MKWSTPITLLAALLSAELASALTVRKANMPSRVRFLRAEPPSSDPNLAEAAPEAALTTESADAAEGEEQKLSPKELEVQRLKDAEEFIVEETGQYDCRVCGFSYDSAVQGTDFLDLPSSWRCPQCLSQKGMFTANVRTIAGFQENRQYGFGGNNMTGEQKNQLIFGSLAGFFIVFLLGYLLE